MQVRKNLPSGKLELRPRGSLRGGTCTKDRIGGDEVPTWAPGLGPFVMLIQHRGPRLLVIIFDVLSVPNIHQI